MKKYAPLLLFLLLLVGCNREPAAPTGPIFDMPSLVGKTMGEIEKTLGAPAQSAEGKKTWQRDGVTLVVEYSPSSDLIKGFTLEAQGEPRKDEARDIFLKTGNLKEGDARYQISFIEAPDKVFYFTGVRVDVPQTHNVEFVLSGPQAMISVTTLVAGGSGTGDSVLTIPPWNTKTTANIGQQLVMAAAVITDPKRPAPKEKLLLQIVVNGRVLKETTAVGSARVEVVL
jgi:hypothetical protein